MAEKKERQEFKWDTEKEIGTYGDDKQRHTVKICELRGVAFVQDTKEVCTQKGEWKRAKGNTMKVADFESLQQVLFNNGIIKAPKKVKAEK